MKTISRFLAAAALCAGACVPVLAQDGGDRAKGAVLLLKNGHAMEGDIERVGTQFCIRRGTSEVWIAGDRATRLCADWDEAFGHVRSLVNREDAGDLVKLARWCHLHQLHDKALEQARRALALQPGNSDVKSLVMMLERSLKSPPVKSAAPVAPAVKPAEPAPAIDMTSDVTIAFTTRVQPILMNTCANCHATGHGGKFHLDRVSDNTQKGATQRNLAAVMAYVDIERPAISVLLTKAITPHGGATAPAIKSRDAVPLQTMQQWIEFAVARNPHLKDYAAAKKNVLVKLEPEPKGTSGFASQKAAASPVQPSPTRVEPIAAPADEFDGLHFNRHFHPQRDR